MEICPAAMLGLPESESKLATEGGESETQIAEQKKMGEFQTRFANLKTTYKLAPMRISCM